MKIFWLSCLLILLSLKSLEASQIYFKETTSQETSEIQQHLLSFYAQQLFEAGLVENLETAIQSATAEWFQETIDNPNKKNYYYHIVSKDFLKCSGYIVYSITDRTAYLDAIYLEGPCRGQGFGKLVLEVFETDQRKNNIEAIKLYVFAHNIAAFKLYGRMGYLIETSYYDGNKTIGHHMKKNLSKTEVK
ncbi:MAG: GNAT family N-acetyltransferase [Parachlamydiaceae bacterium]|nr:GNAT family N-acetyltransferase [Parachlamydiaceae bacterium]